jgi:hypothetical protein
MNEGNTKMMHFFHSKKLVTSLSIWVESGILSNTDIGKKWPTWKKKKRESDFLSKEYIYLRVKICLYSNKGRQVLRNRGSNKQHSPSQNKKGSILFAGLRTLAKCTCVEVSSILNHAHRSCSRESWALVLLLDGSSVLCCVRFFVWRTSLIAHICGFI